MVSESWVLVCDASRARIYSFRDGNEPVKLEHDVDRPASRAMAQDLVTDKPGRVQQSGNPSLKPGMEAPTDPKEVEAKRFGGELADLVKNSHATGRFDELVLVAPPHFLGILRQELDAQVLRAVSRSINKDLTHLGEADLIAHVREH